MPALQHDVVEGRGTALGKSDEKYLNIYSKKYLGLLHPEAVLHLVQDLGGKIFQSLQLKIFQTHLGIGHSRVGNSAKGYQLGQEDSKTPHIRFDGKSKISFLVGKFSHYKSLVSDLE